MRKVETKIVFKKRGCVAADGLKSPKGITDDTVINTDGSLDVNGSCANTKDDGQGKAEGEGGRGDLFEPGTRWLPCNIL
jgi:hypothetical protein